MPSTLPEGEPAPADGLLPASAGEGAATRAFGVYVHVPYCRVRCGYCDFNTYTASELGEGASRADYASQLRSELAFGARALRASASCRRSAQCKIAQPIIEPKFYFACSFPPRGLSALAY